MAVLTQIGLVGMPIAAPEEDIGMVLRRGMPTIAPEAANVDTVSGEIALKFAEMVFVHNYGQDVTRAQLPLKLFDHGEYWHIEGSNIVPSSPYLSDPIGGRLVINIVKYNGQITNLAREFVFEP